MRISLASPDLTPIVMHLQSSPIAFLTYIFETILGLSPLLLIGLFVLTAFAVIERSTAHVALMLLLLIVPIFEWVSYRQGQTFGFWRYYITLIPAGAIAGAELVRLAPAANAPTGTYRAAAWRSRVWRVHNCRGDGHRRA